MKSTNISCYGDRHYKNLLSFVAMKKGINVAKLVRDGLDIVYASELADAEKVLSIDVHESSQQGKGAQ